MKCVVVGGAGALGHSLVSKLHAGGHQVANVDFAESSSASVNILLGKTLNGGDVEKYPQLVETLNNWTLEKIDAVFCVAGGWQGGNAKDEHLEKVTFDMFQQNVMSAALATKIAAHHLKKQGILSFISASASLHDTPGMLAYGMVKSAINHLVSSLAKSEGGLPKDSVVFALLPETLDTPANRGAMPNADTSTWTPTSVIAEKLVELAISPPTINGQLIQVETRAGKTVFNLV